MKTLVCKERFVLDLYFLNKVLTHSSQLLIFFLSLLLSGEENSREIPISIDSDGDHTTDLGVLGRKRKQTYEVWNHFMLKNIANEIKTICNYCGAKLVGHSKNGTNHLKKHLDRCALRKCKQTDIRQAILNPTKQAGGKVVMGTYHFDQDHARTELGKMIILHEYPLCMVEHVGFRNFVKSIQPLFRVVSRNTIKNDIMKIYDLEKVKMMRLLEDNKSRIAVTTDLWTSNQKKGFMVITAHFIDDAWRLQSRVMRFIYVPCPHTAELLSTTLFESLLDWNIDCKLSTLTVDNCSTNDAMINILLDNKLSTDSLLANGDLFHMRCSAHILNLIVKEGLENIEGSVEKIRDSVSFWISTPKRWEKFENTARQLKISCGRKLVLDCKTRWNSTYVMLHTASEYIDVFFRLKQREPQYKSLPSDQDWKLAKEICDRLKLFYVITELFSGTKYPTANLFFPKICEIKLSIRTWTTSAYSEIRMMALSMMDKFEKYWDEVQGILAVATVLDPRFKMMLVEYYFPRIYGNERAAVEIVNVSTLCQKLISQYVENESSVNNPQSLSSSSQVGISLSVGLVDELDDFDLFVTKKVGTSNMKSELDLYLEEPVLPRSSDFDLLNWWKANSSKYNTLQKLARDILAIPVSTVASESAFSTSGRFVSPHRSRLHPSTLEALMCAQNWLWADIHENSPPSSSYTGCCSTITHEETEEEESLGSDYFTTTQEEE